MNTPEIWLAHGVRYVEQAADADAGGLHVGRDERMAVHFAVLWAAARALGSVLPIPDMAGRLRSFRRFEQLRAMTIRDRTGGHAG